MKLVVSDGAIKVRDLTTLVDCRRINRLLDLLDIEY